MQSSIGSLRALPYSMLHSQISRITPVQHYFFPKFHYETNQKRTNEAHEFKKSKIVMYISHK